MREGEEGDGGGRLKEGGVGGQGGRRNRGLEREG